jgi:endothelin-converting enzyme/putative endopeptidase
MGLKRRRASSATPTGASPGEVVRAGAVRPTREAEAVGFVNRAMAMDVGRLYVEARFSEADRGKVAELLTYLKRAMAERLRSASWLDEPSRKEALAKLEAMSLKAGYPRRWPEPLALEPNRRRRQPRHPAPARLGARREETERRQRPQGDLVPGAAVCERQLWGVLQRDRASGGDPATPVLRPRRRDPAQKLRGHRRIVGHEMGHGFDDQGLLFDAKGAMRNWMSPASQAAFSARAKRMIAQVDAIEPLPGVKLDGRRTVGETTSDLTGLALALRAYELWRLDHKPGLGLAEARRVFFRSWAKVWLYKATDDAIRHIARFSYTVPARYRVNQSVRNIDAWYEAFNVKPGDKLYVAPADRVRLW